MLRRPLLASFLVGLSFLSALPTNAATLPLSTRLKGHILLQVESHGEAWYFNPTTNKRYYLKDGPTAYEAMRSFGLGITESDYQKLVANNKTLKTRLAGRIVLRAQAHGEAYYIHPKTLEVRYLANGAEAYRLMRELSLGITNANLNTIPVGELIIKSNPVNQSPTPVPPTDSTTTVAFVPTNIDVEAMNVYWITKVNLLRLEKGLPQLTLEPRFEKSATNWANYMASIDTMTHDRPNGQSMHQWIETQGIPFTERNTTGGWKENYFSENIAWTYVENSQDDAQAALDEIMKMFLSEAAENGPHYRTQYHADWNSEGAGFAFKQLSNGKIKLYATFHYGSVMRAPTSS